MEHRSERRVLAFRGRSALVALFPQESRTFRSNQLCVLKEKTAGSSYSKPYIRQGYPSCFFLYSLMDGRNLRHSCRITG